MINTKEILLDKIKLLQGDSLKAKSARGVLTLGVGTGFERTMRFIRTMILTRILLSEQFGLMAIILVLVNVFEQLAEFGIKLSVIQNKRGSEPEYLNATWWLQAVRGLVLFILAMFTAPLISSFYDKPHLLQLLRVCLLAIIFRGFINPRAYILQKNYQFNRVVLLFQGSALFGTIVTIVYALIARNIWALVIGYLAEHFMLCVMSYILVPFRPSLSIDRGCLKELITFARGMFGMPILTLIVYGAPTFVLGKLVTEEKIGLYYLAYQLANLPMILFTKTVSPVILPGFTRKQDNQVALYRALLKVSHIVASISIPLVAFMAVYAGGLLFVAWGPDYVEVTVVCAILSMIVMLRSQASILSSVYVAVGKPYLQRRYVILITSVVIACIYPAIVQWGLVGAGLTVIVSNMIGLFMQVIWARRVIPVKWDDYIKCYIPGLIMAFPTVISAYVLFLFKVESLIVILVAGAVTLLTTYLIYFGNMLFGGSRVISFSIKKENNNNVYQVSGAK